MANQQPGSDPADSAAVPQPGPSAAANPSAAADPPAEGRVPRGQGHPENVRLLVKALGMLPAAERDQVYAWLLERGMAGPYGTPGPLSRQMRAALMSLQSVGGLPSVQHGAPAAASGQQVVPVRFAADQHAALRAWCSEHGFSMAVVIRGLVARFLEGQGAGRN